MWVDALTWPIAAHHVMSHQVRPAGRMHEIGHRTHSAVDRTAINAGQSIDAVR